MSIKTIRRNKIDLKTPSFNCDHGFNERLNDVPMLSHLNSYSFNIICGRPGSGKTSLLVSMLTGKGANAVYRKKFESVLVVMPENSRSSLKNNIFEHHKQDHLFNELNFESINKIYDMLQDSASETPKKKTLLILDDIGAQLKKKEILYKLKEIIFNRRHTATHIVMLVQSWVSIPLEVRKMCTNAILFKPSKSESEYFFKELFETQYAMMDKIIKYSYRSLGDYLFLNVDSQKLYRKFDEIVITTDDDIDYESESEEEK
jgi:KaiC/GvpD/RAD55 family RecA-like ATPase